MVCIVAVLVLFCSSEDVLRAYPSPERHDGVAVLARFPAATDGTEPESSAGDFDADGFADTIEVQYHRMEPLLRRNTSGLVRVRSGRTNEVLLVHAIGTPMNPVCWCGDYDGNGTDDLGVQDRGERLVLGRVRG